VCTEEYSPALRLFHRAASASARCSGSVVVSAAVVVTDTCQTSSSVASDLQDLAGDIRLFAYTHLIYTEE